MSAKLEPIVIAFYIELDHSSGDGAKEPNRMKPRGCWASPGPDVGDRIRWIALIVSARERTATPGHRRLYSSEFRPTYVTFPVHFFEVCDHLFGVEPVLGDTIPKA